MSGQPSKSRRIQQRFLTVGKAVLLVGVLITIGLFSAVVGMKIAVRQTEIATPDVTGKSVRDARELLSETKLELAELARRYDAKVEKDAVISQSPAPEVPIKEGRKVRVVVSLGPRSNPVPSLVGGTLRIARAKLVQTDYELGHVSRIATNAYRDEEVIQQYPEADSEVSGSESVDLLVAKNPIARYIMPDIVGRNLSRVYLLFERNGFKIGRVQYRGSFRKARNTILRQYPEPGYILTEGDPINIEVAR